jgi:hypothetical protein
LLAKESSRRRKGGLVGLGDQHQGKRSSLRPRGEDKQGGGDAGKRQTRSDLAEGAEAALSPSIIAASPDPWDAVEEGLHQEGGEGDVEGGVDDDEASQAVGEVERREEPKIGVISITSGNIWVTQHRPTIRTCRGRRASQPAPGRSSSTAVTTGTMALFWKKRGKSVCCSTDA